MSNWTTITEEHLRAAGHGAWIDNADTVDTGTISPVTEAIEGAVARVRGACAAGNALDLDTTKVPNSLRSITVRMALFALLERLGVALSDDQRDTKKNDNSYLLRISDQQIRFEQPDQAAGTSEMQESSGIETVSSTNREHYSRKGLSGL